MPTRLVSLAGLEPVLADAQRPLGELSVGVRDQLGQTRLGVVQQRAAVAQVLYAVLVALQRRLERELVTLQVVNDVLERLETGSKPISLFFFAAMMRGA